jgi:hypothetical protein
MRSETNQNTIWLDGYDSAVSSANTFDRTISKEIRDDLEDILKEKVRIEWHDRDFSMTLEELFMTRMVQESDDGKSWDWVIREKKSGQIVSSGTQTTKYRAAFECEGSPF